jgi:hypothetical protein
VEATPRFSTTPNGAYIPPVTLIPLWQLEQPLSVIEERQPGLLF